MHKGWNFPFWWLRAGSYVLWKGEMKEPKYLGQNGILCTLAVFFSSGLALKFICWLRVKNLVLKSESPKSKPQMPQARQVTGDEVWGISHQSHRKIFHFDRYLSSGKIRPSLSCLFLLSIEEYFSLREGSASTMMNGRWHSALVFRESTPRAVPV